MNWLQLISFSGSFFTDSSYLPFSGVRNAMWLDRGVLRAASENYKKIHLDYPKQLCTQLALYKEHRARSPELWILLLTVCTLNKSLNFLCVSYQITHVNINGYI